MRKSWPKHPNFRETYLENGNLFCIHFWSLDRVDGPLDSPPYVRAFVNILETVLPIFSETWQLDRTRLGGKNVPSGFLKKNS